MPLMALFSYHLLSFYKYVFKKMKSFINLYIHYT